MEVKQLKHSKLLTASDLMRRDPLFVAGFSQWAVYSVISMSRIVDPRESLKSGVVERCDDQI